jgi:hypothetical protein
MSTAAGSGIEFEGGADRIDTSPEPSVFCSQQICAERSPTSGQLQPLVEPQPSQT